MSVNIMPAEDYVLYADTKKSLDGLNKRMLFIMVPIVLLLFLFFGAMAHVLHVLTPPSPVLPGQHVPPPRLYPMAALLSWFPWFLSWFPWFLVAECVFLYVIVARSHKKQKKPIVVLSSEGVAVDTTATHIGLIRWDEIEEFRSYNLIYRYVGIVPKNTSALCRRLGARRSWMLQVNAFCIPLYKLLGIFVAPINIPQVYLAITVDELTARIRAYQAAYARPIIPAYGTVPVTHDESIWPPPPAR